MDKIKELEKQLDQLREQSNKVVRELNKEKNARALPPLKEKYVGKWFKRTDDDSYHKFVTYYFVIDVVDQTNCRTLAIQMSWSKEYKRYDHFSFIIEEWTYLSELKIPSSDNESSEVLEKLGKMFAKYLPKEAK